MIAREAARAREAAEQEQEQDQDQEHEQSFSDQTKMGVRGGASLILKSSLPSRVGFHVAILCM